MSFLSKLFKKEPVLDPVDLSILGTDVHSHLIPGIDDGSKNMEETLIMLKGFIDLGYKKVITTPHVMSDFYKNTPETILGGLEKVRDAIAKEKLLIKIDAAAEYYLDFHFEDLIEKKEVLTFGDNCVLFELSFMHEPTRIKEAIFNLQTAGYTPILAHVERYPYYHNQWETLEDFKNRGCLFQLNTNSLSGVYGPGVKKMAEELIDKEMIDLLGSDCHHKGHIEIIESLRTNKHVHKIVAKESLLNKKLQLT
ncbi:MAG: tyrosine-protein phosphatase [Crocinitomicaceae bacterium]